MDSCMEISKALSVAEAVRTEFGGRGGESEAWGGALGTQWWDLNCKGGSWSEWSHLGFRGWGVQS